MCFSALFHTKRCIGGNPMEIKRDILDELIAWKNQARHKPLLLQGARQIGKSWLMEYFGREYFESVLFYCSAFLKLRFSVLPSFFGEVSTKAAHFEYFMVKDASKGIKSYKYNFMPFEVW